MNKMIVGTLPLIPRGIVRIFASKYIAGDKLDDAVVTAKKLNEKGIMGTIDVLGEDVFNEEDALRSKEGSLKVLEAIDKNKLDANLSIKLTSLGLKIGHEFCLQNVSELLSKAMSLNIFIRIDMEDSNCTDETIRVYDEAKRSFSNCGIVLQSYLRRTYKDAENLINSGKKNFRLCKGVYVEPEEIAYKDKQEVRDSYLRILKLMLETGSYVGIATHDDYLVDGSYRLLKELNVPRDGYEFQMLLGVRDQLRDRILKDGHKVRVYIPFGTHWYQYSIRRFKENPQMAGYVVKSIFTRGK